MKLASLKSHPSTVNINPRDGVLVVVSRDLNKCITVPQIATTMQSALDNWQEVQPQLNKIYQQLNQGLISESFDFQQLVDNKQCHSPLPRAYQWADGSAYLNHVELVRKARGAEIPSSFLTDPLMYQGGADAFVGPRDLIYALSEDWGIDFEAEICAITGDLPIGATVEECGQAIRLLMLVNDVSLRNLIPGELNKGFGFFQSKPASAFSPVAITPDELGDSWREQKVNLPLNVYLNEKAFGKPNAGVDVNFNLAQLVHHITKTRECKAGSIVGSGTVSNKQGSLYGSNIANGGVGYCCIAEVRMFETIEHGKPITPFMKFGDKVRIEMFDEKGSNLFGTIEQSVNLPKGIKK